MRWPRSIGRAPYALFNIPGVIDSDVCLRPMVTPESVFYFKLFQHYKNNILPYSGGLLDQPAVYLQIMELIDSLLRE